MPEILLRPDLGKRAYRLRCRFTVDAYPTREWLDKAKVAAAEAFVKDMGKQGWQYQDKYGFRLSGPFPAISPVALLSKAKQNRWHLNARYPVTLRQQAQDNYVANVPALNATDKWEFELAGVFVRPTILTEVN